MFRQQQFEAGSMKSAACPECKSPNLMYKGPSNVACRNCGHKLASPRKRNKFGAVKTIAQDGLKRDSKFEANVADDLLLRKKAGDIKDYDSQYKVEMWIYREDGVKAFMVSHKVDFRIHHNDNSFELYEAKGIETADYKFRRKLLENVWLPLHPDHTYTVVKERNNRRTYGKR
jgi:uncharacterized Zn finger protein (UPF0148 family)